MTTMELHMNNLDSGISSEVKLEPNGLPNTNARGDLKRKSLFDSTYVKPLSIVGVILLIGIIIISIKALTPEETIKTVDGGDASTIRVNGDIDGRDQLDVNQAKYLTDADRAEAEKNAREGVSSAAVLNRAEVTTDFTTYGVQTGSDASAVTTNYQTIPKTVAQLDAENLAAGGELYSKGSDNDNNVVFTNKSTGQEVIPIDKVLAEGFEPKASASNNATYNTNSNYNANNGGQNQGDQSGGQGQGGQNGGQGQGGDAGQQQERPERQPDPVIEAKRAQLSADFEAYQAQQAEIDAKEQQLAAMQQQRYQEQQSARSQAANQSLSESLSRVQQSVGASNSYSVMSYNDASRNQNGGQGGQAGQPNGGYSSNQGGNGQGGYQGGNGQGGYQGGNGQNNPVPYQNTDGSGYLSGDQSMTLEIPANGNNYQGGYNGGYNQNGSNNTPIMLNGGQYNNQNSNQGGYANGGSAGYGNGNNSNGVNVGFGQSNTLNNAQNGEIIDQRLPNNIVRAGTKWQAIITKAVNTDEGLQVIAELVTGKFAGSTIYGTVQPSGRNIGVQFSSIAQRNSRKPLIPISSYATTIGEQKTAISTDVKNHYTRNYGIKGLSAVLRGVGEAYDGAGETSIITDSGNVITTKDSKPDASKIKADVLGELGKDLTSDISKLGNRPPTYKVPIGTVVNVVLASDLDINQTTSSISLAR